ncbi:MAG: GerMN domain-containing protein [Clostridiales bacterium]|nr:GerMN domain-containing protein [Clostridiales bacterium]
MIRSTLSILLIIMIFVTASGLPLYANDINISFDFDFSSPTSISKNPIEIINTDVTMLSKSKTKILIDLDVSDDLLPLELDGENPITLSLYSNELVDDYFISDLNISQEDNNVQIEFELSQSFLDIPNGDYELELTLNIKDLDLPIISPRISLGFFREFDYIKALDSIDGNQTALSLYFPDNDMENLIPITRLVPYTNYALRTTVNNLLQGPDESLGLPINSPIPEVGKLDLKGGRLHIYLPEDIGVYNEYSSSARIALDSLVNSLIHVDGVNEIQFYFNNRILSDGFHGIAVDEPFYPSNEPKFYIAYITKTDRALLFPIPMESNNLGFDEIFNILKYGSPIFSYNYSIQPSIPNKVILNEYSLDNGSLELELNDEFLIIFQENPKAAHLMIDSIVHTFTSLDIIDSVVLKVANTDLDLSENIYLNQPLYPTSYINPEK